MAIHNILIARVFERDSLQRIEMHVSPSHHCVHFAHLRELTNTRMHFNF